jgi:hypothetical protein
MWIEWIEPFGPNSEPVYCRVTRETAIATQRHTTMQAKNFVYSTDADALEDFKTVRWARELADAI